MKPRISQTLKESAGRAKYFFAGFLSSGSRDLQLVLYIIIILLLNLAVQRANFRIDLTRYGTYTLSDKSVEVVKGLKENLKIRVLFSKDLPAQHAAVGRYLKDLLEEYAYHGNEFFSYEIVDEKNLEREAASYGIRPVQTQDYSGDQVVVRRAYMGLVIQQADLIEKMETVTSAAGLEYGITTRIEKMSTKISRLLDLKAPLTLTLYLPPEVRDLPIQGMRDLEGRVQKAVEKCNAINYGKIKLRAVNPSQDAKAAEEAAGNGVSKIKWGGAGGRAGEAYFGMVLDGGKKREPVDIPVSPGIFGGYALGGLENLEDRINDAVGSVVSANPRIGYITGHGEAETAEGDDRNGASLFRKSLSDRYEFRDINLAAGDIPADIGMIIINGPTREFTPIELYRIDQYLMKGRSAVFFIDSFTEINLPGGQGMFGRRPIVLPVHTGLEELLGSYGVTIHRDVVLDGNCAKVNLGNMIKDYPLVPIIRESGLDRTNGITRWLRGLVVMKASSLAVDTADLKKRHIRAERLLRSSEESWLMTGEVNFDPFTMSPEGAGKLKSYTLAASLSGRFRSAFSGRDVPQDPKAKAGGAIASATRQDSTVKNGVTRIVAVGTSEVTRTNFLMDARKIMAGVSPRGEDDAFSNLVFLHNIADHLNDADDIAELRSKSLEYNPVRKTSEGLRLAVKAFNFAGLPLLVVVAGLVMWRLRGMKRRRIQERFIGGGAE